MTSYSTVQKQQLSQLGAYLQEKRQEQGKSLEDISLQTYIRAQLLKAVESGDTTDLPQPIFVQGFIRRYADALGLDGANFAKQFPVHSIPNTPRPVPRPATQVDMSYQTASLKPPVQTKPNQPKQIKSKPAVGAMPLQQIDLPVAPTPATDSVSSPEQPTPAKTAPEQVAAKTSEQVAAKKTDTGVTTDFTLDPKPMSDSELSTLGLNNLGDGSSSTSTSSYQSAPFTKTEAPPDSSSPVGAMPTESAPMGSSFSSDSGSNANWLPWGIGAVVVVGAIALIGPRVIGNGSDNQPESIDTTAPQAEVAQPDTSQSATPQSATPQPEPVPASQPEPAVSSAPVSVQVEITEAGPSWMSVTVDGKVAFEGLLDPGTKETWEGQNSITMNVGNAGAAMISANGSEPAPAGNPGGAEFLTFTPTDAAAE